MRPMVAQTVNRLIAAATITLFCAAAAMFGIGVARADGILNATESQYVARYGESVVCASIVGTPTPAMVLTVVQAVMQDGFAPDSAVDVTNASVALYCPSEWPLLQKVGRMARGEQQA